MAHLLLCPQCLFGKLSVFVCPQSVLWVNMSVSLIVQCLVIYFSALGTHIQQLSDSTTDCG